MPTGYCTLDDVRRALREAELPGDIEQDEQIAVDAVVSQTEWLEKTYKHHWYEPDGIEEATAIDIPTEPKTRDDEHDIPTHGGFVHGASERDRHRYQKNSDALLEAGPRHDRRRKHAREPKQEIRIAFGDLHNDQGPAYTRITLDRKDVKAVNALHVVNEDGLFDDWTTDSGYGADVYGEATYGETTETSGGVGNVHRGKDYWVRINNGGVSELYLDVNSMADDIASLSNAVYVDIDYGHEGIPRAVRRAVAYRAGAELTEEAAMQIPDNAKVYNVETKAEAMREKAEELLEVYL